GSRHRVPRATPCDRTGAASCCAPTRRIRATGVGITRRARYPVELVEPLIGVVDSAFLLRQRELHVERNSGPAILTDLEQELAGTRRGRSYLTGFERLTGQGRRRRPAGDRFCLGRGERGGAVEAFDLLGGQGAEDLGAGTFEEAECLGDGRFRAQ